MNEGLTLFIIIKKNVSSLCAVACCRLFANEKRGLLRPTSIDF
jgi:hypothetical protein